MAPNTQHRAFKITLAIVALVSAALFMGQINNGGGGGSSAFSAITGGTNTTAAMVIGTGASLATSGTGSINTYNYYGTCGGTAISNGSTSVVGLGLVPSGAGTCATANTPTTSVVGASPATNCNAKNLSIASSAVGVNASDGAVTLYTGTPGTTLTASSVTCTIGTGKSCQDTTHTVAVTAGQVVAAGIATQTSSTLANMSVSFQCQ